MTKDYQINVLGLGETFLENNTERLKNVSQLVLQEIDKNDKLVGENIIEKDSLPIRMMELFDKGVSHLKVIKIYYIEHGLRYYLTEIEIF